MRRFLLFFAVLFAAQVLTAQTKFRIGIAPDLKTYTVYMKTDVSLSFPNNVVSSGQVGLVVPRGGFIPANVSNYNHGVWGLAAHYMSPEENNRFDYLVFSFTTPTSDIPFVEGEEIELFSFENIGTCTGDLEFVDNEVDPFWPPNSLNAQIGNYIGVGPLQENFHKGTYYTGGYGCDHELSALCGITFNGIDFTSPTTCGASDGTLTIFATTDLGLDLVYSIDGGGTFHASNVFTGLNSGDYNVVIRDIVSICIENVGSINVPGPLGPLVISNDLVNPDCGTDNGSITLNARTDFGDPVEFSIDGGATFTQDSVFTGLGEGTHNFVIKNTVNLCQTLQSFTLMGCAPVECIVYYEMEKLADGRYQVVMLSDTTWAAPQNITGTMQVTWRAPAGGFEIGDLQSKVPNVTFGINGVVEAPSQAPAYDYFSVGLTSLGTGGINYIKGQRIPLFCFSNLGDCQGGEVELIDNDTDPLADDPTQDVKQQLFTNGMGDEVPICLNENNSVPCEMTPIPCLAEFELNETMTGGYVVSMTPDVDYTGTQARTMELVVTLKVPTGTFVLGNLMDHPDVAGIELTPMTEATAPAADPGFDYINVSVGPLATDLIPYVKGQKVNLFTFENTGTCGPGTVKLLDPETDAYSSATAGLFLKTIGGGATDRLVTCLNDQSFSTDCPPVSTKRDTVYVTMTTDMDATECIASVLDLPNGAGAASLCGNGAFVTASVADNSDCVDLSPNGSFNQTDQICVVHCDAMMGTVCDTTIIIICPQVQIAPVAPACAGSDFQISTTGGAGNFTWTPNNATGMTPLVNLSASETYTVVADDGNGCSTTANVAITVNPLPTPSFTFAGVCLGEETAFTNTSGSGLTYSWDFGDSQTANIENPIHTYAASGTYTVTLTVENGNTCVGTTTETVTIAPGGMGGSYQEFTLCAGDTLDLQATGGTSYSWSPADFLSATDIANPQTVPPRSMTYLVNTSGGGGCGSVDTFQVNVNFAPVIANVVREDVTDCDNPDGSIKIFASAGDDSIAYSIDCGATWQAENFFTNLDKGTYAPTVINTVTGCISTWSKNYVISGPSSARLDNVNFTNPTACGAKDASITFDSPETDALEYSIDGGMTWTDTSATFNNLEGGDYEPRIRFVGEVCTTPFSGGVLTIMDGGTLPALTNDFDATFVCENSFKTVKVSIDQTIDTYQITTLGTYSDDVKTDSILSFSIAAPTDSVMVSVELTSAGGCSVTQAFMAYASELPTLAAREKEDTECQKEEGAFLLTVTGGEAPYMFDFTDPAGTVQMTNIIMTGDQPFNDLGAGDHVVAVTDNIGCISDMTVTIEMLPVDFQLTENVSMPNCGEADGSVVLDQSGANLTFEWMDIDATVVSTDSAVMNLPAGDYSVVITDGTTGCFEEKTFALMDAGSPELVVEQTMPVLCEGADNGGVSFHVNGTGEFTVSIQNEELVVLGDESSMIFGLTGGTYDLIVKNNDTGCETIEAVTIAENIIAINEVSVQPTDCAATDGQVCLTLTDGDGPYDITSPLGDMMDVADGTEVCFENVASGIYSFEITDDSGCAKSQNVELAAPNQPVISVDSFAVSGLICPDVLDNGSIVSMSSSVYTIEQNGTVIGMTPAMALAPGTYMLTEDVAGCKAQKEVTLVAPEAWSVDADLQAETCDANDGIITLTVTGANGNYTYDWTAGITVTGNVATGLNADSTYSVVISDGEGCQTELNGLKVDKDCMDDNCAPIFEVENFNAEVPSSFPQICLPLVQSNISGQDIMLNGAPYGGFATVCSGAVITYDVKDLLDFATLPMNVVDWAYGSKTLDDFTFNTMAELVAEMNVRAPLANWRYEETTQIITGEDVAFYGDIVVGHAGSTDPIMVFRNEESVLRTAIEITGEGSHMLVVFDAMDACPDTLMITATEFFDGPDYPDSLSINTAMDVTTETICDAENLQFPLDAVLSICQDPANGIVTFDDNCYQYTPAPGYIGEDVFCIEVCDGTDCQQIMIRATVRGSEVVIHTGISPNGDFTNDALIIENLESYESAKVQIFNRWGLAVYENENYKNSEPWGAEFGEVMLPDGTYFIILDVFSADGSSERFTNYIQVNR